MKFWLSGEIMEEVADSYRAARKDVESALNAAVGTANYGGDLREIGIIAIIRPPADGEYPEIKKYHRRTKDVEFRLKLDLQTFKLADDQRCRVEVFGMILRACEMIPTMGITDVDFDRLFSDIRLLGKDKNWL